MCTITNHSRKRIRKRMGIPKKAVKRQAELALERGYSHSETKSNLKKYLNRIYLSHKTANNLKVYNNHVFLFNGTILITVFKLPSSLQGNKYLKIKIKRS